jgi:hypothetical protein
MHGGTSTGPKTLEGLQRSCTSTWKHGRRSAEVRQAAKDRGEARRLLAEARRLLALLERT